MSIKATCACGAEFNLKPELAGKRVKCPTCGQAFTVPKPQAAADLIQVTCQCGKSMRAKPELAGKRVKCPACGGVVQVPAPQTAADPPPDQASSGGLDLQSLSAMEHESGAIPQEEQPVLQPLPGTSHQAGAKTLTASGGRKKKGKSGTGFTIDANTLRIVVLVLIVVDAAQVGIWTFPSLLSVSRLLLLFKSFGGWLALAAMLAHIGLIVAGVGIFRGKEFGKDVATYSAGFLLALACIGFVMMLPGLGGVFRLVGAGRIITMIIRSLLIGIALPAGILACLHHPAWDE